MIMRSKIFYLLLSALMLTSCLKHEMPSYDEVTKEKIKENVQFVFGTTFDAEHDWCTTSSGELTINGIPSDVDKVQLMTYIAESDTTTSLLILNEEYTNGKSTITLAYDMPSDNLGMYALFISNGSYKFKQVDSNPFNYEGKAMTRNTATDYAIPTVVPTIGGTVESYASQRGWLPGQVLYEMSDYASQQMAAADYSDEYKAIFRAIIFSYFKNGRAYNNLPLIKESGLYNDNMYPFTTGTQPIVISPVYKSDKAKQYGNEIWNSDFYYYYYKESDMEGKDPTTFLNSLPKYKALSFNTHFGETEDDVISKRNAYTLIYWGDGTPEIGTSGSYIFPEGYKIGFMVRAKTEFKENGKPRKQGELYGDGRLNNDINNYSECNFKSSKLGVDGPRMGWITVNDRMLLCCESGTDNDFNDIIIEVEGGVKPIINIPEFEVNSYTFCFEDTELGDYDMNDVVIKAKRLNSTQVEYRIVACGARDKLKVMGINGDIINGNSDIHSMFGVDDFVNTVSKNADPIVDVVNVNSKFSFLDEATQPYIYDVTTDKVIKLSKKGEDPHGIMIPYDFKWPIEKVCIKDAYLEFNSWGQNRITSTYWYKYPVEGLVF